MAKIQSEVKRFVGGESGAALAEYGILIAFIAIVAIVAITYFGAKVSGKFSEYANHLT
jgi:Flp pilus assembly pilin Flp